jgi:hypothetical protein
MDDSRSPEASSSDLPLEELQFQGESAPFVGQWNQLVSTTNWEKGRIICQWRQALLTAEAAATEFSDEAWSRRVGGVTGQHVGRLRRVFQRFGQEYTKYEGLYWSHFQAALDWEDAPMWLEGAVQNSWSVSQMRDKRWEVLEAPDELKPRDEDIVTGELDEDFEPALKETPAAAAPRGVDFEQTLDDTYDATESTVEETEEESAESPVSHRMDDEDGGVVRPFEDLAELPGDVAEAFEAFKLAILRHKVDGWRQISCLDILTTLDSLKELALAPAASTS